MVRRIDVGSAVGITIVQDESDSNWAEKMADGYRTRWNQWHDSPSNPSDYMSSLLSELLSPYFAKFRFSGIMREGESLEDLKARLEFAQKMLPPEVAIGHQKTFDQNYRSKPPFDIFQAVNDNFSRHRTACSDFMKKRLDIIEATLALIDSKIQ